MDVDGGSKPGDGYSGLDDRVDRDSVVAMIFILF